MIKHETKSCPRCNTVFECRVGSIMQCQCHVIKLSMEEQTYIEAKYEDCLCIGCLKDLQVKYTQFREKYIFKQ